MAYTSWSVVFGEQPSAAKWNILGTNDASFNDGTGIADDAITYAHLAAGAVIQVVDTLSSAASTGTTQIPNDDTIPQNTEGTEFMTLAITPKDASSKLIIEASAWLTNNTVDRWLTAALFVDSAADALASATEYMATGAGSQNTKLYHSVVAGSIASRTYKVRCGSNGSGTLTFNGVSGSRLHGGITHSFIKITEVKG